MTGRRKGLHPDAINAGSYAHVPIALGGTEIRMLLFEMCTYYEVVAH